MSDVTLLQIYNKREQMEKEDNKRKKKTMTPWVIMEKNS